MFLLLAMLIGAAALLRNGPFGYTKAITGISRGVRIGDLVDTAIQRHQSNALNTVAQLAQQGGYFATADAIRDKADIARAVEKRPELSSPLVGVDSKEWQTFVNLCKGRDVGEVSTSYQFGLFNIGYRRLGDLGLATGVHRGTYHKRSVWFGKLVAPLTLERFLSDAFLQYKVFCKDMKDRTKLIETKHANIIGTTIEGVSVTLSGLLAVAKLAGGTGLASWIADEKERAKFSQTTAAFKTANGIF